MSPEMVGYYRLLLFAELGDKFYQAFDEALEQENPISELILSLCTCISDETEVLRILWEYTLDHPYDEQAVCDLLLEDMKQRYLTGEMNRYEIASALFRIVERMDRWFENPWHRLTDCYYDLELWQDGVIDEDVFNRCFDAWLFHAERLEAWVLQMEKNREFPIGDSFCEKNISSQTGTSEDNVLQ